MVLTNAEKHAFLAQRAKLLEKAEAGEVITVCGVALLVHMSDFGRKYTTRAPKTTVVVFLSSQAA